MKWFFKFEAAALCLIRKWWRPVTCIGVAGSMIVNGIVIPFVKEEAVDLMGLAALVTACTAAFAVREWGKVKGSVEP